MRSNCNHILCPKFMRQTQQTSPCMRVLIIRDNRPGHFNQSEGVVKALGVKCDVDIDFSELHQKPWLPARILRWLVTENSLPFPIMLRLAGFSRSERLRLLEVKPNLVVSSGGNTLAINALVSRYHSVPNVVSSSLRGMNPEMFSAVLHVDPALAGRKNYIVGLKPSAVERVKRPKRPKKARQYCLLVGGPTRYQPSSVKSWESVARFLSTSRLNWSIVTSRRTPKNICELFTDVADANKKVSVLDFRMTGSGIAADIIQKSDGVIVTEDSTSMISEGIAAGLPVVSLCVDEGAPSSDASYIKLMRSRNWYRPIDLATATEELILAELELCTPTTESHVDILADRLFEQIPALKQFQR